MAKPKAAPAADVGVRPVVPEPVALVRQATLSAVFLGVLTIFAFVGTLIVARPVLAPIVAAALLAMTLMPAVNGLRRSGLPHAVAATIVAVATSSWGGDPERQSRQGSMCAHGPSHGGPKEK